MKTSQPRHGGNLDEAVRRYGIDASQWMDLSTGINPHAYPVPELAPSIWQRLPDRQSIKQLEEAARQAYGVPDSAAVLAASGSAVLIHRLPSLIGRSRVAIAGPTFAEHQAAWTREGHDVCLVDGMEAADARVMVVVNPNNPGGQRYEPDRLIEIADDLASKGGFLLVDEAFADPHPELSVAGRAGAEGLIILRSFGKFFGLAGVRLGFALGQPAMTERLRALCGPWPVSGPAVHIGALALDDRDWTEANRQRLDEDALRMGELLAGLKLPVAGATVLFTLLELPDARTWHECLARQGILTRIFCDQPQWLRIGLPGCEAEWQRFETALSAARTEIGFSL